MNKRRSKHLIWIFIAMFALAFFIPENLDAGTKKNIRIGKYWKPYADSGDEGEGNIGWGTNGLYYYHGFTRQQWSSKAWFLGAKDFTDSAGVDYPTFITGNGQWDVDETSIVMPIPDENGYTIRSYLRHQNPEIWVDGFPLHDPFFGREADESVDPAKIDAEAGTGVMAYIESDINTNMGLSIKRKAYGFTQKGHDSYLVDDWTFTNTGNADFDDNIEYPTQTLEDVYFFRQARGSEAEDFNQNWASSYGEYTTDTLRIQTYAYGTNIEGESFDQFGHKIEETGEIKEPTFRAEAALHIDTSADDPTNDPSQPKMTGVQDCDLPFVVRHPQGMSSSDWTNLYNTMSQGLGQYDASPMMTPETHPDVYPNTFHGTRFDERGYKYVTDYEYFGWSLAGVWAAGPYTLEPGEDFRVVWADAVGSISYEKGWEVGRAWAAGNSEETVPYEGDENLPERFQLFDDLAPTDNDKNADRWIMTGLDSLHKNVHAANWAFSQDFDIAVAPPAPSIYVKSRPGFIRVEWGTESEAAADFAGYKVWRSVGHPDSSWIEIADYPGSATHVHDDATTSRGVGNYYAVTAYDDGASNAPGVSGQPEVLQSGLYLNRTTKAAYLTREAGSLDEVVVVPNPFNISAASLQYTGEQDKIMFLNVPGFCIIDIYSESGDHIKQIIHDDGSGDQSWGVLSEEFSATKSSQVIVSGVYIARIEETDEQMNRSGNAALRKFLVVR